MTDREICQDDSPRRPRKVFVVVEKTSDGGIGHVDISRVFVDREQAERERHEVADVYREMDAEGDGWDMWSVNVRELHCYDDMADAEPISERRHELMLDAADATASSVLESAKDGQ